MSAEGVDYDALEAVAAAATPGPWEVQACCPGNLHYEIGDGLGLVAADSQDIADAALIVAAVNALPDLLARARERDAAIDERDRLRDGIEALVSRWSFSVDIGRPTVIDNLRTLLDQTANDGSAT